MADYYQKFSFQWDVGSEVIAAEIVSAADKVEDGDDPWDFQAHQDGTKIWFHDEFSGPDHVAEFIQGQMVKHDLKSPVEFEWSNDCSKPRLDAYGGGACIVTQTDIRTLSTQQAIERLRREVV